MKKKKNNSKLIVTVIIVAIIIFVVYKIYSPPGETETPGYEGSNNDPSNTSPVAPATTPYGTKVLKRGSRGPEVTNLQKLWNDNVWKIPQFRLSEDGIFGPKTEQALFEATGRKSITLNEFKSTLNLQGSPSVYDLLGLPNP